MDKSAYQLQRPSTHHSLVHFQSDVYQSLSCHPLTRLIGPIKNTMAVSNRGQGQEEALLLFDSKNLVWIMALNATFPKSHAASWCPYFPSSNKRRTVCHLPPKKFWRITDL